MLRVVPDWLFLIMMKLHLEPFYSMLQVCYLLKAVPDLPLLIMMKLHLLFRVPLPLYVAGLLLAEGGPQLAVIDHDEVALVVLGSPSPLCCGSTTC